MKTMGRRLGILLCVALALLSAFYAFAVMKARSGTGFWMVWLAIAACLILLAIGIAADWWSNFPRLVQDIIVSLVFIALVVFGTVEGCVISRMTEQASTDLDYVVVLGAQVRASGPSKVLRYRLDTAIEYLNENPKTICIVSGGRGVNEPFPEAQGMADYLEEHGIPRSASSPTISICSARCRSRTKTASWRRRASRPALPATCWRTTCSANSSPKSNSCSHKRTSSIGNPPTTKSDSATPAPLISDGIVSSAVTKTGYGNA